MGVPGSANFLLAGAQGYQIERSLRFNSADSAYLNRTYSGACQDAKLMTISVWVKRGRLTTSGQQPIFSSYSAVRFGGDLTWTTADKIQFRPGGNGDGASNQYSISTDAVFRDPSAWYHIVIQYDSTQATSTNRQKIYVNGVQQTVTGNYPTQNYLHTYAFNNANNQIGAYTSYGSDYLDSYLTEFHFIDGQALTPSSFGETDTITGVWKPKKYAGTYGTNGFFLKFADNSGTTSTTLGKDSSGNSNNWTPNNFSVTAGAGNDSLIDTPTPYADGGNGRGNYCTWNPLRPSQMGGGSATISNGNLSVADAGTSNGVAAQGTIAVSSGKWYWEIDATTVGGNYGAVGIRLETLQGTDGAGYFYLSTGNKDTSVYSNAPAAYGNSYTSGDKIGVALDLTNGKIWFAKNGTWQASGDPAAGTNAAYTGLSGTFSACVGDGQNSTAYSWDANFGQRPFAYTPPSGFVALNTQNLPEPSIKKPSSYFDAVAYSGDNTNNRTIAMPGSFQPDLFWVKSRSGAYSHILVDSARGANWLSSNSTGGDSTNSSLGWTNTGFTTNGIIIDKGSNVSLNNSGDTYVAWCWDESATPGFDIVTYTGNGANRTIAHSLGIAPSFLIAKVRDYSPESWFVWHSALPGTDFLKLDSTDAKGTSASLWNSTAPTSSVFSLGTSAAANRNGNLFVAYLWSEVAGFSKFGSYTGNGSTDGPFVFTGFRPRWLMIKITSISGNSWVMLDSAREPTNDDSQLYLNANTSDAESDSPAVNGYPHFFSNGFKLRGSSNGVNGSGQTYIFAAFAESPFKYSLAR